MAFFMDSGGGDIYAAETKEACLEAIAKDCSDYDASKAFEVPGDSQMRVENEDGSDGPLSTLAAEYINLGYGYCIASTNG